MEVWGTLLTFGMVLSLYYAYRGYQGNWFRQRELNAERKSAGARRTNYRHGRLSPSIAFLMRSFTFFLPHRILRLDRRV